jgi:imidazolonepropionase
LIFRILVFKSILKFFGVSFDYKNNKTGYIRLLIDELMPVIQKEELADYCDVFCEQNYFTPEETVEILTAAKQYGMTPKVHAEQLSNYGGVLAGVKAGAISVDHLEYVGDKEIEASKNSGAPARAHDLKSD